MIAIARARAYFVNSLLVVPTALLLLALGVLLARGAGGVKP